MGDDRQQSKQSRARKFHRRLSIVVGIPLVVLIVYQLNRVPSGPVSAVYALDTTHALAVRSADEEATVFLVADDDEDALATIPASARLRAVGSDMHGTFLLLVDSESLDVMAGTLERGKTMWQWRPSGSAPLHLPAAALEAQVLGGLFLAFDGQVPEVFALQWSNGDVVWETSLVSGQAIEAVRLVGEHLVVWTSGGWAHVIDPQTGATAQLREIDHSRCVADGALLYLASDGALVRVPLDTPEEPVTLADPLESVQPAGAEGLRLVSCGTFGAEVVASLESPDGARSELVGLDREGLELRWHLPLGEGSVLGSAAQHDFVARRPELAPLGGELGRFTVLRLAAGGDGAAIGELVLVDLEEHAIARRLGPLAEDLAVGRVEGGSLVLGPRSAAFVRADTGEAAAAVGFPNALSIVPDQVVAGGLWLTGGDDVGLYELAGAESACGAGDLDVVSWPDDLRTLFGR